MVTVAQKAIYTAVIHDIPLSTSAHFPHFDRAIRAFLQVGANLSRRLSGLDPPVRTQDLAEVKIAENALSGIVEAQTFKFLDQSTDVILPTNVDVHALKFSPVSG